MSNIQVRIGAQRFTRVEWDPQGDVVRLWKGEPRPLPSTGHRSIPEGHLLGYDEDGELVAVRLVHARETLERAGEVAVHDEDGRFLGLADVADVIAPPPQVA
jgi:uncharacterized protein YuzE